jgi:hypothetical protein
VGKSSALVFTLRHACRRSAVDPLPDCAARFAGRTKPYRKSAFPPRLAAQMARASSCWRLSTPTIGPQLGAARRVT